MKKTVVLGKKLTYKKVLSSVIFITLLALVISFLAFTLFYKGIEFDLFLSVGISFVFFCMCWMGSASIITLNETLEVNESEVIYYNETKFIQQLKELISILKGHHQNANTVIKLSDIDKVQLTYHTLLGCMAYRAYQIKLTFLLKDDTVISFVPHSFEKERYEEALNVLENNGIEIDDKKQIRKALNYEQEQFYQYMEEVYKKDLSL